MNEKPKDSEGRNTEEPAVLFLFLVGLLPV